MSEKMLDSSHSGMTRNSSHLASIYGKDLVELVWENGQILVQGGSSNGTGKAPMCIGYSINPSHNMEAIDEDASITKKTSLSTSSYSLLNHFPAQKNSDFTSSHQSNGQASCQIDLQSSQSKNSFKSNDEFTNLRPIKTLTSLRDLIISSILQQQIVICANIPHNSPYQEWTQTKHQQQTQRNSTLDVIKDQERSTYQGNSATRPIRNPSSARVEEIEPKAANIASTSGKAPDSAKGSTGLTTGSQERTSLITANKSNLASLAERSAEPPLDQHSEAIGHSINALGTQGSHGQYYNQTSNSAAVRAKGKANANLCNERVSSSVCSLGASNDPNLGIRKHEDTDDSTYFSDNDEEAEDIVKEMTATEGNRVKRSRNAEIHNLSERKRRDKINKKMRTLKELIPNCNKVDKASMLDDAIDYLKTLKLQLQIMSMGSGLCMPLMMLPHMNAPHLMGAAGMGFRPGTGIPPQFPIPPLPGITDHNRLQMFGFSNPIPPPMPIPIPNAPFLPIIGNTTSTQPFMAPGTVTNLANPAQLTTTLEVSDLYAKAEDATKQAWNQVSLHQHGTSAYPCHFPTNKEENGKWKGKEKLEGK
ncbi:Myc-type, basic helix-loop-helix [Sesbania bispinosa]|nr:Myc-type, basic helix-loop-helix [Sesbania bispinosa]